VQLAWTPDGGGDGVLIRAKQGSCPSDRSDGMPVYQGAGTSCAHAPLDPSTTYCYRAWTWVEDHEGAILWSSPADDSATTGAGDALTQFDLVLNEGWNMVSVPLDMMSTVPCQVFGDVPAVYEWDTVNGEYDAAGTVEMGRGYWVAASEYTELAIRGLPAAEWAHAIYVGWNLIGSMWDDANASVAGLYTIPVGPDPLRRDAVYRWNGTSFDLATELEPGNAYWLSTDVDCTLYPEEPT